MKKYFIAFLLVLFVPSLSAAVDFSPTKMQLTAPEMIQYDFDGSALEIPVTVTGTSARTWFFVYTKDKAEDVVEIQNGYLGWHWMNRIDTCVYISSQMDFGTGQQTVTWNGQDSDGGSVPPDDYTYYLWAYDFENPPESNQATPSNVGFVCSKWRRSPGHLQEKDENFMPLSRPFFTDYYHYTTPESGELEVDYVMKWTIGQDPLNEDLVETTDIALPEAWRNYGTGGAYAPKPDDFTTWYSNETGPDKKGVRIRKFTWVPNDLAEFDDDWKFETNEPTQNVFGPFSDGNYLYFSNSHDDGSVPCSNDYILDFDGELVARWQKDRWILVEEYELYGYTLNAGPLYGSMRDSYIYQGTCFTLQGMIEPIRFLDSMEYPDPEVWINQNGDYVQDRCTEPDSPTPWANGGESAPYAVSIYSDANYFSLVNGYGMGPVSCGFFGPDGTGVGYIAWGGETGDLYRMTMIADNGSAYDGIYTWCPGVFGEGRGGLGFIAHDSIKGVISSKVSVADEAPVAFEVEQNSPNPANPTTTISFTLPEAGNVTVEVFNVAGQKVGTLVNDFMDSGRHSVVCDGSNLSTGVYFYTVTSGEFSKTMKMTLLK